VAEHDAQACAHLAREVLIKRKTVFELEAELKALRLPTLIVPGDRDAPSIEPSMVMCEWIPHAGLVVFPWCGHTANLEELLLSAALLIDLGSAVFYAGATTASFCAQKSCLAPRTL
jgi:pimeloyl-ACP methyl ester carboxylesterase